MSAAGVVAANSIPINPVHSMDNSKSILGKKLFGTTFSPRDVRWRAGERAKEGKINSEQKSQMGNWRNALDAMDELGDEFNFLRLGAYWEDLEKSENNYDWKELDELLDEIERKGKYGVLLTVGMKAPRWPEYYIPKWALPTSPYNAEISKDPQLRERTKKFIEAVVNRYKGRDMIKAWQVENEPMDRSGEHHWFIGADFVKEEAELIRSLDQRPLVINCWCELQRIGSDPWEDDEYAVRNAIQYGDILGLDIYPNIDGDDSDKERRTKELPTEYIKRARDAGKDAWVIESQAEPWGEYTPDLGKVESLVAQHIEQGFQCVLLWGFEWWWEKRFTEPALSKKWFEHIRWEARRFGIVSRVFHNWKTNNATNLASYNGKLYLTVVGNNNNEIWLLSSDDDGKNWTTSQVLGDAHWQTQHPVGIAFSQGKLYLTVVGNNNNQIWLLSSNDEQYNNWDAQSGIFKDWKTNQAISIMEFKEGLNSSESRIHLSLVGLTEGEIYICTDNPVLN
ncbi:beta-galactosidase [Coleofasciculus sp. E2-BRE-01]|uniref:beta-galactosidase n=1 Tax=Coleofasciculus sp. E2-BRE-01 TaxID=3069524 RepID=UPI0032F577A1